MEHESLGPLWTVSRKWVAKPSKRPVMEWSVPKIKCRMQLILAPGTPEYKTVRDQMSLYELYTRATGVLQYCVVAQKLGGMAFVGHGEGYAVVVDDA